MNHTQDFSLAVQAALDGQWDQAHHMVQDSGAAVACWIHAVLHKMEGDEGNSRYWYARARRRYEDYSSAEEELHAIAQSLRSQS